MLVLLLGDRCALATFARSQIALLAPEIVDAILVGRQPPTFTLQDLRHRVPDDWSEQLRSFGFGSDA